MSRRSKAKADFMYYVYILESIIDQSKHYVGYTTDLKMRLNEHNSGKSIHTNKFKPWKLKTYLAFEEQQRAIDFEAYLKTSSGRSFSKKRL